MRDLRGRNALVTGASGGIGKQIARTLAAQGMNVAVSGRREEVLAALVAELQDAGVRAEPLSADLFDLEQADALIDRAHDALGPLDVLVNNAGVEWGAEFTEYTRDELISMVNVNLTAPMLMARRVLPGMLERGRGHIVFMSSLAGKMGPPYQEPYAATKAGLIGLTQSLRAEYVDAPVGFSVICPGFVEGEGMYQRMVEQGLASNRLMGTTTLEKIADKLVDAIRRDRAEVIESGSPIRPILAFSQFSPKLPERAARRIGLAQLFRGAAAASGRVASSTDHTESPPPAAPRVS